MMNRIESVKGLMIKSIAEYGTSLHQLRPEENLTVVVYFFTGRGDGKRSFPSQTVLNVKKFVLQQYRESKISMEDLKQNIRIIQF
jgi:1,4-dihydroxy-2-naphthoyl-CoA synthase